MSDLPYVIVRRNPDAKMLRHGRDHMPVETQTWFEDGRLHQEFLPQSECASPGQVYKAMLSASPPPISLEEIVEVLTKIIEADDDQETFRLFGVADSIDNDGVPYQSAHLHDTLQRARSALSRARGETT